MPPKVAAFIGASAGLPSSIFTRLELAAISNAVPLHRAGGWPVVLFSTGYGIERQLYTGLVQDLASHGYVVVAIDHPHDANIVSFPDGHAVSIGNVGREKERHFERVDGPHRRHPICARCSDASRPRSPRRLLRSPRPRPDRDVRPFPRRRHGGRDDAHRPQDRCRPRHGRLPLRQGRRHGPRQAVHALCRRPGIPAPAQPGPVLEPPDRPRYAVDFAGAAHLAFTDLAFLVPQLAGTDKAAAQARLQPLVGTINPKVAYEAQRAHVLAFFDQMLKGKQPVPGGTNSFPGVQATGP